MLPIKDPDADSVLLADIVGRLLLVVFSHPENVLLAEVGTLLVVFSHPEKVLLAEIVGTPLLVVFQKPEEVLLEGLADDIVSTEERVAVMDDKEPSVLLVPRLSELVGELLVTPEEPSEVVDGPLDVLESLEELTVVKALVDSAGDAEGIFVLDDDVVVELDNKLFVPLEDVVLETTSLDNEQD